MEILKNLSQAKASSQDLAVLESFRKTLAPVPDITEDNLFEEEFLHHALEFPDDENPYQRKLPSTVFPDQGQLDNFVHYVFDRRFGWSETDQNGNLMKTKAFLKGTSSHADAKYKTKINELLDEFLKWFLYEKVYDKMLIALKHTISQAQNKPVVRNQTVIHLMDWLKAVIIHIPYEQHDLVQGAIVLGLTDVWSAIRNACVSRLSHVIEHFSLVQLQTFFNSLVKKCNDPESTWQAREGAIMGINNAIRRFQWIGFLPDDMDINSSPRTEYFLKFGREELPAMPEFISGQMHEMIFRLLAHPQLSVRENAIKAYSSYISRCEFKEAQSSFSEVVRQLCRSLGLQDQDMTSLYKAIGQTDFLFMDPYEAEGLLGVCIHLVKHIQPGHLLPSWPQYFSTFALYLMHPASTVRLTTSTIFKFLVAKDSSNPIILKLVLQGLCSGWKVDMGFLCEEQDLTATRGTHKGYGGVGSRQTVSALRTAMTVDYSTGWEWREGRLLAYELILQFLIKNHWLYTFGSSQLTSLGPPSSPRGVSSASGRQSKSINKQLAGSYGAGQSSHQPLRPTLSSSESVNIGNTGPSPTAVGSVIQESYPVRCGSPQLCMRQTVRRSSLSTHTGAWDIPTRHQGITDHTKLEKVDEHPEMLEPVSVCSRLRRPRHSISTANPSRESDSKTSYFNARRLAWSQSRPFTQASSSAGAAEFSSQRLFTRLPTITGYADQPSLRTLVRHYSYYYHRPSVPYQAAGSLSSSKAASLLMHTLAMDIQTKQEGHSPRERSGSSAAVKACLCPQTSAEPTHSPGAAHPTSTPSSLPGPSTPRGPADSPTPPRPEWFIGLELDSLASLLNDILLQSIESMADIRWELRRMGQQLLPCVVEVIRWYDMALLEELWEEHLNSKTSLLTFGSCLALKHSLSHAARLQAMIQDPPPSWQDPDLCRHIILRITESIKHQVAPLSARVHNILRRPIMDKLTGVSMATLILAHTHFSLEKSLKAQHLVSILEVISCIFVRAHPEQSQNVIQLTDSPHRPEYSIPVEGFLSCVVRGEGGLASLAKQVEKHVLSEINPFLSRYLRTSNVENSAVLLPILVFYVGHYCDDDQLSKALIDSVSVLIHQCNEHLMRTSSAEDQVFRCCLCALRQLSSLIADKSIDLQTGRQVMELYLELTTQIPISRHAQFVLTAIATRINITGTVLSAPMPVADNHGDLALRSNDIPVSPNGDVEDLSSEEEDPLVDPAAEGPMHESQLLNNSGGSSTNSTRLSIGTIDVHQVAAATAGSDSGSDWDDWSDEEDEDQSAISAALSEFLNSLKKQIETPENLQEFTKTVMSLPPVERRHVEALM